MQPKMSDLKDFDSAIKALNFALEFPVAADFLFELHNIAILQGFSMIAKKACLSRESMYKTLMPNSSPRLITIIKILNALGMQLQVVPTKKSISKSRYSIRKNSLAYEYPNIASEWHSIKNSSLLPTDITSKSRKKIWWECQASDDHVWAASVECRVKDQSCPFCKKLKSLKFDSKL